MNAREVAVVLKMLTAAVPGARLDERTPDVWANVCATVDPDIGAEAANRLVRSLSSADRFPAPADFLEFVRAVKREREPIGLPEGGATDPPLQGEDALAQLRKAREIINARKASA